MENKKAQGMSTTTIILLILGIVVLVVLILGFTMGWNRIAPWLSTNNVDIISGACSTACSTNSQYEFCSVPREVKDGVNDKFEATCYELATEETYLARNYGIAECPSITCE